MQVIFPANCTTEASRLSFCYKLDEALRQEHNAKGADYRNGVITKAEWETYLTTVFEPRSKAIHAEIGKARAAAGTGTFWTPDLTTDIA